MLAFWDKQLEVCWVSHFCWSSRQTGSSPSSPSLVISNLTSGVVFRTFVLDNPLGGDAARSGFMQSLGTIGSLIYIMGTAVAKKVVSEVPRMFDKKSNWWDLMGVCRNSIHIGWYKNGKRMPLPGIEPGLSDPQSEVLNHYTTVATVIIWWWPEIDPLAWLWCVVCHLLYSYQLRLLWWRYGSQRVSIPPDIRPTLHFSSIS